jgi:hypothetical protein
MLLKAVGGRGGALTSCGGGAGKRGLGSGSFHTCAKASLLAVAVAASRRGQNKSGVFERSIECNASPQTRNEAVRGLYIPRNNSFNSTMPQTLSTLSTQELTKYCAKYCVGIFSWFESGKNSIFAYKGHSPGYSNIYNSQQEVPVRTYTAWIFPPPGCKPTKACGLMRELKHGRELKREA